MVATQRTLLLIGITVALGSLGLSRSLSAQAIYPGVQRKPSPRLQPKLSPYLDLLRRDNSVLSPYHSFVLPRRELHQQQLSQAVEIDRLQQATYLQRHSKTGVSSRIPTGRGGQFQTYLHFFRRNERP
jgi:hypothetical protein